MGLTSHERSHMEHIKLAYPKVKAKADAGHEGCKQRILEYEESLAKYAAKAGDEDGS